MKNSIVLAAALAAAVTLSGNASAGDASAGKGTFDRTCANCHSTEIGVNKVGPSLWDIMGRPVANTPGFTYSDKMLEMSREWGVWDDKKLDLYLTSPRGVLHGVKMYFKGLPDSKEREDVIAYLWTLK